VAEPQGNLKLGAAVMGGYLLGRFKKGRQAMRLAAYLNGGQTPPEMLIGAGKQGVTGLMANDQAAQIVNNIKGPLMASLQDMLMAQISTRVERLSTGLENRTTELHQRAAAIPTTATDAASGAADKGKGAVGKLTDKVRGKGKKDDDEAEASQSDEPEEETTPEEPEDQPGPEEQDEGGEQSEQREEEAAHA
jgi:hypothetical protein